MKEGWEIKKLDDACEVEYGTRVVRKRDGGTTYPVYGGGGATFFMDTFNREDCMVVARFAMSNHCTRFVKGKFFLNDSGLTVKPKNDSEILPNFLNLQIHFLNDHIYSLSRGTAQRNLDVPKFRNIQIAYPKSLTEQQRIISILDEAFAAIDKAKANAEQNLYNAKELFESYLQGVFESKVHGNKYDSLNDLCELIVDCEHKTAPIQETGYPSIRTPNIGKGELILENVNRVSYDTYIKWTRRAIPKAGDLILAREAPAGNIAVIPDNVEVCLGQRTVLIRPKKDKFIPKYLAYLILSRDVQRILLSHSKGATVQHINMKDIRAFKIYGLSDLFEQQTIVRQLDALRAETQKLEAVYQKKIDDLEELKKSILQKAFAGELTSSASISVPDTKVIPLQKVEGISSTDLQAGITALALQKHIEQNHQYSFHHVKAEKIVHLSEYILNIDLNRNPVKDAAGPNDFPHAKKVESRARKAGFYSVYNNGDYYDYKQGNYFNKVIQKAQNCLGENADTLSQIIDIIAPMSTQQAEIVATIYAAWNNLLMSGIEFTDEDIVTEARENWHRNKMAIERNKFFSALAWMKKIELFIPKGNGKMVEAKVKK